MESIDKSSGPLFVIGSPRSGTSLLRLILTSHSQILIPPECGFIIWLHKKYGDWQARDNNEPWRRSSFITDLFKCKKFDTWFQEKAKVERDLIDCQPASYADLCRVVYFSFASSIRKKFSIWGDKNNFHINHLDELHKLYETARFIHIVRDGRDVACSYREVMSSKSESPYAPKLVTDIGAIAVEWSSNVMKVDKFMSVIPVTHSKTIRYEDLVTETLPTIKGICSWLGVGYEAVMLDFYKENRNNKLEPALTLDWKKKTLQPITDSTVGRHSTFLRDDEHETFLKIGGRSLRRFDYI